MPNPITPTLVVIAAAVSWVIVLVLVGNERHADELKQEQALYCEMVATFKSTGGEFGWPDYKGSYEGACQ